MIDPPDRELAVFSAARHLPVGERAAYLAEACAGDPALRRRVEELLKAGEEAGAFLDQPAISAQPADDLVGPANPNQTVRIPGSPAEKAGDRIGR
ncbi:MAG TPA: hypothetical protein VNX46_04225, partial [Candidatus Acidoferrum sp.]|nr:hypothetical protein [Candidatus Acidoferrum sp.]